MNNMLNKEVKKGKQQKFSVDSERLEEMVSKLNNALWNFLFEEKRTILLKHEISNLVSNTETEMRSIKQITKEIKEFYEEDEQNLQKYITSFENKIERYSKLYGSLMHYPLHMIGEQLKLNLEEYKIAPHTILELVENLKQILMSVIFKHIIAYEEVVLEDLCDQEMANRNINYFIKNTSLRVLHPDKYVHYLEQIHKGIKAFYLDFTDFARMDSHCQKIIDKFFDFVLLKIRQVCEECKTSGNESIQNSQEVEEMNARPIFKSTEAYKRFKLAEKQATRSEEIGFLFRLMSENQKPPQIVVKETVFRKWYNESADAKFELKNAIKTMDRIGKKEDRILKFSPMMTGAFQ